MQHEKPAPLTLASADYKPVDVYCGLRDQILRLPSERRSAGFSGIVGALMETGYQGAVASVVMLADGTTSLYLSSGGGVIGAGQHKPVALATAAFLKAVDQARNHISSSIAPAHPILRALNGRDVDGRGKRTGLGQ